MTTNPESNPDDYVFDNMAADGEEFMRNPTSSADPIEIRRRNTKLKFFGLAILGLVTLGLVVFISLQFFSGQEVSDDVSLPLQTEAPIPNDEESATATAEPTAVPTPENPVTALYPEAPKVTKGEVAISIVDNTVETSNGEKFSLEGSELSAPTYSCRVEMEPTDFCLAASGEVGETVFNVYYLKDAAHSKLFQDPSYWMELEVAGSSGAGLLPLVTGSDSEFPTIVALNSNSSGWMAVFQEADRAKVAEFADKISLD